MMKLAIQVEGHPDHSLAAMTAYQFIRAALLKKHHVLLVFFYYDGVGLGCQVDPKGLNDRPSGANWRELANDGGCPLVVCSAALERRGLSGADLAEGFIIGGLGSWVDACLRCDRHVTFAA